MNTPNYEKAYKEALERAKMILCNIPEGSASVRDIETIFPELRESEDERIRKELVNFILYKTGHLLDEDTEHKFVAYLEKPKEQQSIQDKEEREYVRTLKSLISDFLRGKDEIDRGYYQKIYDWLDGRHIEQKPKQEWSEEDRRTIDRACVALRAYANGELPDILPSEILGYADKLQSLRPSWKPSEEQMEAFRSYIKDFQEKAEAAVGGWNNFDVMIRLYEQLKKLM